MTYQETIDYLYAATPAFEKVGTLAYKEGLTNTLTLDEHFGHPHQHFQTIHVAGTNGKGSTSHTLAAILQSAGYNVGLYTSPHLIDFRERIKVNGLSISEKYVIDFIKKERPFFEPLSPSFFEITTALAFKYFADQQVDIAVIEVGLGGRLDCTNIITPILSVITNISFDHTQFLGNTLEKIAAEKAGIIKAGIPVVIGETIPETRPVFEEKAKAMAAPIFFAEEYKGKTDFEFELKGIYQEKNKRTILCAMEVLSHHAESLPSISKSTSLLSHIQNGLAHVCKLTGLMGRWQTLQEAPLVICDTGHNVAGWQYLSKQISAHPCKTLRIVFGMVDDKDINTVLSLLPKNAVYYWTQASSHRAIPAERIAQLAKGHNLKGNIYPTVFDAFQQAKDYAEKDDFIFVGGSSYIVADLLTRLSEEQLNEIFSI